MRWKIIKKNPFELVENPKYTYKKRDIWNADTIRKALDECRDSKLYVAMNLSFACSLRIGEILGLTWDNIHISKQEIAEDNAHLFVEKELQRASTTAINILDKKDVIRIFPAYKANALTRLVLKTPKTESSVRKVWIPKTLAYILQVDMVTKVYAHILDEDRKVNAVKMEAAFYSGNANPDLREVKPPASKDLDIDAFIENLKSASPEKLALLAELMKS